MNRTFTSLFVRLGNIWNSPVNISLSAGGNEHPEQGAMIEPVAHTADHIIHADPAHGHDETDAPYLVAHDEHTPGDDNHHHGDDEDHHHHDFDDDDHHHHHG